MGDAVEPLEQGNGGQFGQPDLEGLAEQRHQRRVVRRGLAHPIDQAVEVCVAPAPEVLGGRAGGLDVAAVVEPEGEVRVAHGPAVAHDKGAGRALSHAGIGVGKHAEGGVETRAAQLLNEHGRKVLEERGKNHDRNF